MNEHSVPPRPDGGAASEDANTCKLAEGDGIRKDMPDPLGDIVDRIIVGTDRFIIYSVVQEASAPHSGASEGGSPKGRIARIREFQGPRADHVWLRTKYPGDYECAKALRAKLSGIAAELAYICDVVDSICRSGTLDARSSASLRRRATEMMARAMEMAYEDNVDEAKELLRNLRLNITTLRDSKNRMRYVQGNLFALAGILVLWGGLRFPNFTASLTVADGAGTFSVHALDILALGAMGAFFSVSASVSSIRVDHSVSLWEMVYTGFVRIPIGVIAAGVTIFLISGHWLLASIQPDLLPWTYLLTGFLAGFSELFVPNALRQVEAASSVAAPANAS